MLGCKLMLTAFSKECQDDVKHVSSLHRTSPYTLYSIVIVHDTVGRFAKTIIVYNIDSYDIFSSSDSMLQFNILLIMKCHFRFIITA